MSLTPRRLPPLNWLRSFEAAARHLSFTAAAEELHVTQSAVSQQVKLLEGYLGRPLFLRRPRGLVLTDAGRDYLDSVVKAFRVLAEGTAPFIATEKKNMVRIMANASFAVFWLMPRITRFLGAHPAIEIDLSTALSVSDYPSVGADVEIRYGRGEWQGEEGRRLNDERIYPVCSPAVAERLREPADLTNETLLHLPGISDGWDMWAEAHGLEDLRGRDGHYFNTFVLAYSAAARGMGVALGHDTLVRGLVDSGELAAPFDLSIPGQDGYFLVLPQGDKSSEPARAFSDWLVAEFA